MNVVTKAGKALIGELQTDTIRTAATMMSRILLQAVNLANSVTPGDSKKLYILPGRVLYSKRSE